MTPRSHLSRWKWCLITSFAMVLLSLVPQIHLWIIRGREWNGAYVSVQGDESLYSAYINALMDGRPRKNDPFGGKDNVAESALAESTFSIQFIPAYAIALPARLLKISASTAFIAVVAWSAFLASLSIFWLLDSITGDSRLAASGSLFVLCFGWVVGRYGIFNTFVDIGIPALHFLRRYQPAVAFPLFFAFHLLVWRALNSHGKGVTRLNSTLAGMTLAILIFSYLFLWTAAAAWLGCIGVIWLYGRPAVRGKTLGVLTTVAAIAALALVP